MALLQKSQNVCQDILASFMDRKLIKTNVVVKELMQEV